jgi:glycosyltransferase involved in cell wall biosynthesis
MKVLVVHNRYQQRGGEDAVVEAEVRLLAANGIEVRRFDADNDSIQDLVTKVQVSAGQFGLPTAVKTHFRETLSQFCPDLVHVHNWFPTLSPAVFQICRRAHIPVIHTLHNYRLLCVGATLFRDGHVCEDCIGTTLRTPGIAHGCYHQSRIGSAVATAGMLANWSFGTWQHSVDRFIALSEFARRKLVEGGLPADKIVVKPNFVDPDPGPRSGSGGYFLYAGRLTEEKGLRVLLHCWKSGPELPPLKIVGAGPLQDEVQQAASSLPNLQWLGNRSSEDVLELMGNASALICPSLWYEGMPRVVIESFAVGTPVIASHIGSYPEMIVDGETGVLFRNGDAVALLNCLRNLNQTGALAAMRIGARRCFEGNYTGERNFSLLLNVYRSVLLAGKVAHSQAVPAGI